MTITRKALPTLRTGLMIAVLGVTLTVNVNAASAGSLENLERERAIVMDNLFSSDLTPDERYRKVAQSRHRLVDLERLVIRDPSLEGSNTPVVRRAFANYDLTFLVHASIEKGRSIADHWMDTMGLSTDNLMNARVGRRY
jgi:hypothetical protein